MAVIGATFYVVLPRLTAAFVDDPLRDTLRYLTTASAELRAKAVASQTRQVLNVDIIANRLFVTQQANPSPARPEAPHAFALGADLHLAAVLYPQKGRVSTGVAPICFHRQGHADQAMIQVAGADGRRFSFYIDPFLPAVKVYSGHVDHPDPTVEDD